MRGTVVGLSLAVALGCASAASAAIDIFDLGQSAQNFTLYGQGSVAPGIGSFKIGQGSGTFDAGTNTSTFDLTGAITGGPAGFSTGTYDFVTTYAGNDTPQAGPNAPSGQSNPSNVEFFFYSGLDPSTQMTLFLTNGANHLTIPLVTNGQFDGPGFSFGFVTAGCTGVATCDQNLVGLTSGATIAGPVDISVSVDSTAVPEPATWALMLLGVGAIGAALRFSRKSALQPAVA
jgi:hypothetical protein